MTARTPGTPDRSRRVASGVAEDCAAALGIRETVARSARLYVTCAIGALTLWGSSQRMCTILREGLRRAIYSGFSGRALTGPARSGEERWLATLRRMATDRGTRWRQPTPLTTGSGLAFPRALTPRVNERGSHPLGASTL